VLDKGSRLGTFEIVALIGAGGMGQVYRARDTRLDRDVAIKVLPESIVHDPDRLARFEREGRVLAALNHPLIAQVYGFEQSGDTRAIVMELVEGETLEERIAQGPIPVADALHIARQLAEALETAHELGIIHRDLKPANISSKRWGPTPAEQPPRASSRRPMSNCTVKVLDFGLAKALETTQALPTLELPTLTAARPDRHHPRDGRLHAPEQARSRGRRPPRGRLGVQRGLRI
jgi:serine/threonine protein kinase